MNLVVDCSFIMSSVLPDEKQLEIEKVFKDIFSGKYKVFVPAIFYLECNNVLISALKKKRITINDYEEYLQILSAFPFNIDKFCSTPESLHIIGKLSNKYALTSYDAAYLELSMRLEAKIATLDNCLAKSCKIVNIDSIIRV